MYEEYIKGMLTRTSTLLRKHKLKEVDERSELLSRLVLTDMREINSGLLEVVYRDLVKINHDLHAASDRYFEMSSVKTNAHDERKYLEKGIEVTGQRIKVLEMLLKR